MPPLIRYVIANFATGFGLGAAAALALAFLRIDSMDTLEPLALALQIFALAAPCGLGFLGSALMIDAEQ